MKPATKPLALGVVQRLNETLGYLLVAEYGIGMKDMRQFTSNQRLAYVAPTPAMVRETRRQAAVLWNKPLSSQPNMKNNNWQSRRYDVVMPTPVCAELFAEWLRATALAGPKTKADLAVVQVVGYIDSKTALQRYALGFGHGVKVSNETAPKATEPFVASHWKINGLSAVKTKVEVQQ